MRRTASRKLPHHSPTTLGGLQGEKGSAHLLPLLGRGREQVGSRVGRELLLADALKQGVRLEARGGGGTGAGTGREVVVRRTHGWGGGVARAVRLERGGEEKRWAIEPTGRFAIALAFCA